MTAEPFQPDASSCQLPHPIIEFYDQVPTQGLLLNEN